MDSPYDLIYPEGETTRKGDYYDCFDVKCFRLARFGYKVLWGGRDRSWSDEKEDYEGKWYTTEGESEGEGDEEESPKGEQGEHDHHEKQEKKWGDEKNARFIEDKNKAEIGEEVEEGSEGQSESCETEHTGQEELPRDDRDPQARYFDPSGRSSAEYALILQKVPGGNNTYRRIGILIQHRSVEPHEAPRPFPHCGKRSQVASSPVVSRQRSLSSSACYLRSAMYLTSIGNQGDFHRNGYAQAPFSYID